MGPKIAVFIALVIIASTTKIPTAQRSIDFVYYQWQHPGCANTPIGVDPQNKPVYLCPPKPDDGAKYFFGRGFPGIMVNLRDGCATLDGIQHDIQVDPSSSHWHYWRGCRFRDIMPIADAVGGGSLGPYTKLSDGTPTAENCPVLVTADSPGTCECMTGSPLHPC